MFIFSNLAMSIDGKISTARREFFSLGTGEDHRQMEVLRRQCDALLIGASTFRCYQKPSLISGNENQPVNMILSSTLKGILPQWEFFKQKNLRRILFVSHLATSATLKKFSSSSEIVVLKRPTSKNPLPYQILKFLESQKLHRLLVEGGGEVMWDFVRFNLIDEYHITLTPKVVGGADSPTLVDGIGFTSDTLLNLKLRQCKIVGNEVYLTYAKV